MALINVTVISECSTLLPWKITSADPGKESIKEYYERTLSTGIYDDAYQLSKAFLGRCKDNLDLIELNVELQQAVSMFGHFLKFIVTKQIVDPLPSRSAVDVLMSAQRNLCEPRMPKKITRESPTKKDKLFNDVVDFMEGEGMSWRGGEADSSGRKFVSVLVDCLWYIDGRIHVFEKQGCKLPDFVSSFKGYNKPELSKHRKRGVENMCASVIRAHSSSLFSCLQSVYWNSPRFQNFKLSIELLAESLADYGDYLGSQNKRVKEMHSSPVPVCQLSDSLSVTIIKKSGLCYPRYRDLVRVLGNLEPYQHISLTDICPDQPRERYKFIHDFCFINLFPGE